MKTQFIITTAGVITLAIAGALFTPEKGKETRQQSGSTKAERTDNLTNSPEGGLRASK